MAAELGFLLKVARPGFWLTSVWFYLLPLGQRDVFAWLLGWRAVTWIAALFAATALYNWPRLGSKGRPGLDLLNQAAYLLVFVLSSWLNGLSQVPWFTFVFGALFAMHSHLFGEIMDLEPDRAVGRRTTAVVIGRRPAKSLMIILLAVEACVAWQAARDPWIAAFLAGGALFLATDVVFLWRERPYTPGQMRLFFLGWNAAALFSIPWVWRSASFAAR